PQKTAPRRLRSLPRGPARVQRIRARRWGAEPQGPPPRRLPMASKPMTAEMHPGPGFRIRKTIARPTAELVAAIGEFQTAVISDGLNRLYTMSPAIRCLTPGRQRILGPACTVKVFPGDNLMVHKSLDIAAPNDVVVVDA